MTQVNSAVDPAGTPWLRFLHADPLPWLLDEADPAVRHLALRDLLGRPDDDPELLDARRAALTVGPVAAILDAQHPDGYWSRPGSGYQPKYTGTVWQVVFLEQLGADGTDPRIRAACDYVLRHAQASTGAHRWWTRPCGWARTSC